MYNVFLCYETMLELRRVEGMLAMNILCSAAETTLDTLHLVQSLASGSVRMYNLSKDRETSGTRQTPILTRESLTKRITSLTYTECGGRENAIQFRKGTRFTLPTSTDSEGSTRQASGGTTKKSLKTLNVLGMQPDFSESLAESMGNTLIHSNNDIITASASKPREEDGQHKQSYYSDTQSPSVKTQSLLENESIPEMPLSQYSSNTIVMDPGSSATLGATGSMSKSAGLLVNSNSYRKNLDSSLSNLSMDIPTDEEEPNNSTSSFKSVPRKFASSGFGHYSLPIKHCSEELSTLHEVGSSLTSHQEPQTKDNEVTVSYQGLESQCTHFTHSSAPLSGGAGVPGSQVPPSTIYRRSTISTPATELHNLCSTTALGNTSRFENWPNEVVLTYTINMASIVIFGRSSLIQKVALEGFEEDSLSVTDPFREPQQKYGLMQLVEFSGPNESDTDLAKRGKF